MSIYPTPAQKLQWDSADIARDLKAKKRKRRRKPTAEEADRMNENRTAETNRKTARLTAHHD